MGEKNKLSRTDLTKIRAMRDHGVLLKDIAKEFGVTKPAIFFALQRLDRGA